MMLKNITIAICDICGRMEQAVMRGNQRDEYYDVPDGWQRTSENHEFCICPKCWKKLNDKG